MFSFSVLIPKPNPTGLNHQNINKETIENIQEYITLHKLSLNAGISYSTLSSFMRGKCKTPNLSTILHICEGLNIDLFEFFQDEIFKNVKDE